MNNLVLALAPKFTKLQVLSLRQDLPQLEDDGVDTIANYCHELQDLDLSKSFKLTDRSLYALAHGCPNLTKLNISGCSAFSDSAVAYLAECCRNLRVLNLCGCVKAATDKALKVCVLTSQMTYRSTKGLFLPTFMTRITPCRQLVTTVTGCRLST